MRRGGLDRRRWAGCRWPGQTGALGRECRVLRLDVAAEGTGRVVGWAGVVVSVVAEPVTAPEGVTRMLTGPSTVRFGAGGCAIVAGVLSGATVTSISAGRVEFSGVDCAWGAELSSVGIRRAGARA